MAKFICSGAKMVCTGSQSGNAVDFTAGDRKTSVQGRSLATVNDNVPAVNIPTFGICKLFQPPKACVPSPAGSFAVRSSKVTVGGVPVPDDSSTLQCTQGGTISFQDAGQTLAGTGD